MRTIKDAVYGVAVGDALGVPVQGRKRDTFHVETMTGYGVGNKPPGTWSDDTSLTLATLYSLEEQGRLDIFHMRDCFREWYDRGAYTPWGETFGAGVTTMEALRTGCGLSEIQNNGNGSLMRMIPLAFLPGITKEGIEAVSAITHGHPIAKDACVIYVRIAKRLLKKDTIDEAVTYALQEVSSPLYRRLSSVKERARDEIRSTGYVVDTLYAALWCLYHGENFKDTLLLAVNLGDDTDTVGAVTGGLAGILYGYDAIPKAWIEALQGKEVIEKYIG